MAYALKTKCLDTDRTLRNLEKKMEEKVQEIFMRRGDKSEFISLKLEADVGDDQYVVCEEPSDDEDVKTFEEVIDKNNSFAPIEMYEEIEYLEQESMDENFSVDWNQQVGESIEETNLICAHCSPNIAFDHDFNLKRHKWEVHSIGRDPLVCSICQYVFSADTKDEALIHQIQKHESAHKSGKLHSCLICPEIFKTLRSLEDHQQRYHFNVQSSSRCKGCQFEFLSSHDLQLHLMESNCKELHERPFKCYICSESFAMGITKKKHVQVEHQDKKGADCPLCLRCKIPSAVAFENHYKTHFASELKLENKIFRNTKFHFF